MTEQEYKELQAWCQSGLNKGTSEYKDKVTLRNKATQIRRNIIMCRTQIRDSMRVLEGCKELESRVKWLGIVEIYKANKRAWQEQFKNLQLI